MSEPFLGELKMVSFNFAPRGWAFTNGQLLPINQNQALFSLLGTTFGGNGQTTFALPNLQGRAPFHSGAGFTLGQSGGESAHTLTASEMPAHTHTARGSAATINTGVPTGNVWAAAGANAFSTAAPGVAMGAATTTQVGGNQPHSNQQPCLVLNFVIALQGIFPSRP